MSKEMLFIDPVPVDNILTRLFIRNLFLSTVYNSLFIHLSATLRSFHQLAVVQRQWWHTIFFYLVGCNLSF